MQGPVHDNRLYCLYGRLALLCTELSLIDNLPSHIRSLPEYTKDRLLDPHRDQPTSDFRLLTHFELGQMRLGTFLFHTSDRKGLDNLLHDLE